MNQIPNIPGAPGNLAGMQMSTLGRVYPGMLPMTTMAALPMTQGMTYGASQIPPQLGQGAQMGMMPQSMLDAAAAANEKERRVSGNMLDYAIANKGQEMNYYNVADMNAPRPMM